MLAIIGFLPLFIRFRTSVTRIQELLDVEREETIEAVALNNPQELVLRGVDFRYDNVEVLRNLNMVFRRGEATALIGSSGKGKTTLIRILLSLIQADRGQVEVIGDQYRVEVSAKHRTNFAYVPQGDKHSVAPSGTTCSIAKIPQVPQNCKRFCTWPARSLYMSYPKG